MGEGNQVGRRAEQTTKIIFAEWEKGVEGQFVNANKSHS